jgi:predicted nucleic acid-binding protein
MNAAGVLLDTGPLVALLSRTDANLERAKALFQLVRPAFPDM